MTAFLDGPWLRSGIGKALAAEFVRAGDNVIISSRSEERVRATTRELQQQAGGATVAGIVANVSKPADVAALAVFAADKLGTVDLWCESEEIVLPFQLSSQKITALTCMHDSGDSLNVYS